MLQVSAVPARSFPVCPLPPCAPLAFARPPLAGFRAGFAGLRPAVLGGPRLSGALAPLPPWCRALTAVTGEWCADRGRGNRTNRVMFSLAPHHKIWYPWIGGDHNMEENSKIYKALMAMTEAEAAALDFLASLEDARQAMRECVGGGENP